MSESNVSQEIHNALVTATMMHLSNSDAAFLKMHLDTEITSDAAWLLPSGLEISSSVVEDLRKLYRKIAEDDEPISQRSKSMEDLTQFVPKYYTMDPEREDLLPNGTHLRNGMQVLVESSNFRSSLAYIDTQAGELDRALKYNRWCTVSDVEALEVEGTKSVSFIAKYEDGTKRQMVRSVWCAWYVRIDTIPEKDELTDEMEALSQAMADFVEVSKVSWKSLIQGLSAGRSKEALREVYTRPPLTYEEVRHHIRYNMKVEETVKLFDEVATPHGFRIVKPKRADSSDLEKVFHSFVKANVEFFTSKEVFDLADIYNMFVDYLDASLELQKTNRAEVREFASKYFASHGFTDIGDGLTMYQFNNFLEWMVQE